eukprot:augustus_masked-scaffold_81-processed-gene-0.49-mRNA-1 protein AED:1.00 eAED:1.00 QI:0/-1/0/0/-1/1/1/0/558
MTDREARSMKRDKKKKKQEEGRNRKRKQEEENAELFGPSSSGEEEQDENIRDENIRDENIQDENIQDENVREENIQNERNRDKINRDGSSARDEIDRDESVARDEEAQGAEDAASAEAEEVPANDEEEDVVTPAGEKRAADEAHHLNLIVTGTGSPDRRGVAGGPHISTEEPLLHEESGVEVSGADDDESSAGLASVVANEDEVASAPSGRGGGATTWAESITPIGVDLVSTLVSEPTPRSGAAQKGSILKKLAPSPKRSEIKGTAQELIFPPSTPRGRAPAKKTAPPAVPSKERTPISKGGTEVDLTGDAPTSGGKKAPKKKRKKNLAKRDCEFYTKVPRYFTPSKYVVCEDDLREAQKKMDGRRAVELLEKKNVHRSSNFPLILMIALAEAEVDNVPLTERAAHMLAAVPNFRESKEVSFGQLVSMRKKAPIRLLATNMPTWYFHSTGDVIAPNIQYMADRGLAVINGNMPKPNVAIRDDPTRPRRVKLFRWLVKADPHIEKSLIAPKRKIRRSEHMLTDKEKTLQSRINSLTDKNERLRAQAYAAENVLRDKSTA